MRIIGPPSVTYDVPLVWASKNASELFTNQMLPALWGEAILYGIDPLGVIAQSFKETAGGTFPGKVKADFCNPCGLKVRVQALTFTEYPGSTQPLLGDQPLAHQIFQNWRVGARAHVQHLRAYTGWPLPVDDLLVDPRYSYVVGKYRCENWSDLSGKWAPAADYGSTLETIISRIK